MTPASTQEHRAPSVLESAARLQLTASILRSGVLFAFQWAFGRFYGPEIFGIANTAQAGLQVATMVGRSAGDTVVLRGSLEAGDATGKAISQGVTLSLVGGVLAGLALAAWGVLAPVQASAATPRAAFYLAAATVPLAATLFPLGAILQREQRFLPYTLITTLIEPLARFAVLLAVVMAGSHWLWAMAGFPIAAAAALFIALLTLRTTLHGRSIGIEGGDRTTLIAFSGETTVASALQASMFLAALTIAAGVATGEDVGRFAAAARIVMLSLWIQTAYATSFLPQIPALLSAWGRREDLDRLYKRVIRAVLWVNGPLLVGLAAGAEGIMELFGSRFGSGAALLLIVTVGQWLNSTTALAEDFLPLSGRSRLALMNNLGALMLTGIGAYVLGQSFGIGGVALAYAGATALLNVVRAVQVRRLYGISIPLGTAVKMTGIGAVVLSIWFFLDLQLSAAHLLLGAALCGLATFLLMTVVANRAERSALIALIHPRAVVSGPAGQT